VWIVGVVVWLTATVATARLGDRRSFFLIHAAGVATFGVVQLQKWFVIRRTAAAGRRRADDHREFAPLLFAEGVGAAVAAGSGVLLGLSGARPVWWLPVEGAAAVWVLVATIRRHRETAAQLREIRQRLAVDQAVAARRMSATMRDTRGWVSEPPPDLQAAARRLERSNRDGSRTVA